MCIMGIYYKKYFGEIIMDKKVLRFIGYFFLNCIISTVLIFAYGTIEVAAGYLILVMPISAGIATVILFLIKWKFENIKWFLFLLLLPIVNVLGMILLFVYLFATSA